MPLRPSVVYKNCRALQAATLPGTTPNDAGSKFLLQQNLTSGVRGHGSRPVHSGDSGWVRDKLNLLPGTGQIGPGGLGTHAWPVEANVFPPVALGEPLAVNNDSEETGQSYEYIVENQFIEVTNKWDSETTYFYFHPLPSGVTQVSVLDSDHEPVTVKYLIEGSRLYHTLDGGVYWVRYFANDSFHEELITSQLVMPRAPRLNKEEAPFVAPDHFAWTHGVIDIPSWAEHRFRFYEDNRNVACLTHSNGFRPRWSQGASARSCRIPR